MDSHARSRTRLDGAEVHAVHAGSGDPVVLVHGLCGSHRWWRHTIDPLAARYRVHVPELIGFGESVCAGRPPDIPGMSALLVDWLDARGLERVRLVGHSMGAQISIHLAADHPERVQRLVLVSPAGVPRDLDALSLARFAVELVPPRGWGDPRFIPTLAADVLRTGPRVILGVTRNLLDDDVRPLLPRIEAPTLVLHGALDPLVPEAHARLVAAGIPRAELTLLPGAAHNPMIDSPDTFNARVLEFLG